MNSLHTADREAAQTVMSGKPKKGHLQLGSLGREGSLRKLRGPSN